MARFKLLNSLNQKGLSQIKRKPTAEKARKLAYYRQNYNGSTFINQSDSSRFYWSGNRGENVNFEDVFISTTPSSFISPAQDLRLEAIPFDSSLEFNLNTTTRLFEENVYTRLQTLSGDNIILDESKEFNGTVWENYNSNTYTFNTSDQLTSLHSKTWDGSAWENTWKSTYTYDANGNLTESLTEDWKVASSTWENYYKNIYTYDANNNLLSYVLQYWISGSWTNSNKSIFEYNTANQKMFKIYQMPSGSSSWINDFKVSYTYTNGLRTMDLYQVWSNSTSEWVNDYKDVYDYNTNSLCTSQTSQVWSSSSWTNYSKYNFTYTPFGKISEQIYQNWDGTTFENQFKYLLTYNEYEKVTSFSSQDWNPGAFWEYVNGSFYFKYFYEIFDDGTIDINTINTPMDFFVYPIPASNTLNINAEKEPIRKITLYSI